MMGINQTNSFMNNAPSGKKYPPTHRFLVLLLSSLFEIQQIEVEWEPA
jgi:hypothetical protein